jgi:hypothetical protein
MIFEKIENILRKIANCQRKTGYLRCKKIYNLKTICGEAK